MTAWFKKIGSADIRNIIAVISVIGCFVLLYLLIIKPIPTGNNDVLNVAIGFVFGGLLGGVSGFYFGASKEKDKKGEQD